ncbi:HEPN domain-containing protein [Shewanella sp. YLB-07]|uniref:HEPN domain-containing protein n=1 Tax=Shewanella sp. YLB-07 TaxID=2601268 RepID=UPI00128B96FA|nr:HEPN domain-containing protein [Shewanella sp. YLB-07]MPY24537.1 HEPN domain-containing protein [Shewanella sp. YLB-07]
MIAEDIAFIHRRISKSQYFYINIKREGIMLYDMCNFTLGEAKELTAQERHLLAQKDFDYSMKSADNFYIAHGLMLERDSLNIAAFLLHQATEHLYSAILLVFTRYKPNSHDLKKLGG